MHSNNKSSAPTLLNSNSCRQNSTSRSSEINNPMRRSFGANPFMKPSVVTNSRGLNPITPANSPSDYPQRASLTRESLTSLRDFEDKENGNDQNLKQCRLKSPSFVKGGTKNFMSPTISAASKVNASPRKKILAERNEPVRTSGNDFAGTLDVNSKPECEPIQAKVEASSDSTVTCVNDSSGPANEATSASKGSKKKVAFDTKVETIPLKEPEHVDMDEDVKAVATPSVKSPCTASTLLAPLDADPLMPPYDPKTNFLSPRPQFLHYKPSPRIKHYLDEEEGDGNPLEESFNLDGFSDTDFTDETQSDSSQKESSDDVAQEKLAKDVETTEEVPVSEVVPSVAEMKKAMVELRNTTKQRFFTKTKCSALILLMVLAGLWMSGSNSGLKNISAINDLTSFAELLEEYETLEFVKENLEGLAQDLWHYYDSSYSYILELVHKLRGGTACGPLLYYNLTDTQEGLWLDNSVVEEISWKTSAMMADYKEKLDGEPLHELDGFGAGFRVMEDEGAEDGFEMGDGPEGTSEDALDEVNNHENEAEKGGAIAVEGDISLVAEPEVLLELDGFGAGFRVMEDEGAEDGFEMGDGPEGTSEDALDEVNNHENEAEKGGAIAVEGDISLVAEPEVLLEQVLPYEEVDSVLMEAEGRSTTVETSEVVESELLPELEPTREVASIAMETEGPLTNVEAVDVAAQPATKGSVPLMVGVSSVVVALVASTLIYMLKGRSSTKSSPAVVDQSNLAKKFNISPQHDGLPERWPSYPAEVDVIGESCPSEMSSYQNTSWQGEGLNENEAHSYERKQTRKIRRESMASSDLSLGSASYGSFTTYEMMAAKHRNGEEEVVVTPIRRSSRLRKPVISP